MFYIRYWIMPISNKPTISNVLGCYDIEESTISALKSYIDIVALCFNIVVLCFDIECAFEWFWRARLMQGSGPRLQAAVRFRWYWVMIQWRCLYSRGQGPSRAQGARGGGTARAQAGPGAPPRRAAPAMAARKRDQVCTSFLAVIPPVTRRTLCQELYW